MADASSAHFLRSERQHKTPQEVKTMSNLSVMHFERLFTLDSMKRASILKSLEISFAVAIETGEKKQLLSPLPPHVPTIGLRDQNGTAYVEAISR